MDGWITTQWTNTVAKYSNLKKKEDEKHDMSPYLLMWFHPSVYKTHSSPVCLENGEANTVFLTQISTVASGMAVCVCCALEISATPYSCPRLHAPRSWCVQATSEIDIESFFCDAISNSTVHEKE